MRDRECQPLTTMVRGNTSGVLFDCAIDDRCDLAREIVCFSLPIEVVLRLDWLQDYHRNVAGRPCLVAVVADTSRVASARDAASLRRWRRALACGDGACRSPRRPRGGRQDCDTNWDDVPNRPSTRRSPQK